LTNDYSGDYAMILAMLSKLEAEDTSDDSSLSKIIDLFKIDLVDGTLEQITTGKLVAAFNGLEDKFKNTNIDKIKADVIGKPLLVDLPVKNLISDSACVFCLKF
jgi:DNA-binding ferritin-like protein (Dps family)